VALAGVPRARGRDGLSWGVLSAACAVAVVANGGKGAMVALAIGYALVALLRLRRVAPLALACLSLGLLALAFAAPVLRVGAGGDLLGNERSLLFRAMYLDTAWAAFRESPWIGTGPDGFQDASARLRPLGAVEIVRSAHSAFADWPAQLGAGGLAWVAASIALIAWSARGAALERAPLEAPPARDGAPQRLVMVAVLGALVSSLLVEAASLDPMGLLVRVVGGAAWVGAAVTLLPRLWSARSCGARMLFPAALAGLCHAQVEMTLWNPGSVAWVLVTMGAAIPPHALDAARTHAERPPRLAPRVAGASACALVAVACLLRSAGEARVERTLEGAAMRLVADSSGSSGIAPAEARRDAARTLETVSRTLAVAQWLRAAEIAGPSRPEGLADLAAATRVADEAVSAGSGRVAASRLDALHAAAHAWETRALASGSDDDRRAALECALAVTRFDEGSPAGWLRAARQAAALDMPIAAALAAEALSHDSLMALDPLMRLPARDRALAERLARVSSRSPSGSP
jgi:hypothetical protein